MRLPPDDQSTRPLYRQISDQLRALVASMQAGERIASEPELARQFAVSRFTIARSVQELVDDGLIRRRQGSGSFVAAPPLKRSPGELLSFTEAVRASGHDVANRLLNFGPTPWKHGMPYAETEPLMVLERLRLVDATPAAVHRSILSRAVVDQIGLTPERARASDLSLYALFDEFGLTIESGVERLMARLPTDQERKLLNLGEDGVVVAVQRLSLGASNRPLDVVEATYDARRYGYESRLVRPARGKARSSTRSGEYHHENDLHESRFGGVIALGPRHGPWPRGDRRKR
jgi:GntR family transcriptional regulator